MTDILILHVLFMRHLQGVQFTQMILDRKQTHGVLIRVYLTPEVRMGVDLTAAAGHRTYTSVGSSMLGLGVEYGRWDGLMTSPLSAAGYTILRVTTPVSYSMGVTLLLHPIHALGGHRSVG